LPALFNVRATARIVRGDPWNWLKSTKKRKKPRERIKGAKGPLREYDGPKAHMGSKGKRELRKDGYQHRIVHNVLKRNRAGRES